MSPRIPSAQKLKLAAWVTAGLGAAFILCLCLLMHSSIVTVGDKTNELEARRSVASMRGAVAASTRSVTSVTLDNSIWDEAVEKAYAKRLDMKWFGNTWGAVSGTGANYDAAFLVDDRFHVILGYIQGKPVPTSSATSPSSIDGLLAGQFKGLPRAEAPESGLIRLQGRPALASINLIQPVSGDLSKLAGQRRYLVFARYLTPKVLAPYTQMFFLRDVRIDADMPDRPSLALADIRGGHAATISLSTQLSGVEAVSAAWPSVLGGLLLVVAAVCALSFVAVRAMKRLILSEEKAREAALRDTLTGLPNRRAFIAALDAIRFSQARPETLAIALLDLDGFKDVNDAFGHQTGDELIVAISGKFRALLPEGAFFARLCGDEFAVYIAGQDALPRAQAFGKAVLEALQEPLKLGSMVIQVGASIGIACNRCLLTSGVDLLRQADIAMYAAKAQGKRRALTFDASLDAARQEAAEIEQDLRDALRRLEFDVHYQGIFDSRRDRLVGVEALLRWNRRPKGALSPAVFIPVAEQTGLIHDIGLFVLEQACRDWKGVPSLYVSVNVSPSQFRDPEFEAKVANVLSSSLFPPERLELELTEGYLIDHRQRAQQAIAAFKTCGVKVVLDDFGTGYTSIAYLQSYGFDKIKLDKSLIDNLVSDPKAGVLVQGAIFMAHGLSMEITAEGVECDAQARMLDAAGCHLHQGYHYSRPLPFDDLLDQIAHEREQPIRRAAG